MTDFILGVLALAGVVLTPQPVVASAYSCDEPSPMYPCGRTRWDADPLTPGMACPPEWAWRAYYVPRWGRLRCDDTGRYDTINNLPHTDIRVPTNTQARRWGIPVIVIYRIKEIPRATRPAYRDICAGRRVGPCRSDDWRWHVPNDHRWN